MAELRIHQTWRQLQRDGGRRRRLRSCEISLHHTAGNPLATPHDVQRVHLDRGWPHIGYHYLIDEGGVVFKTLPLSYQPICVRNNNNNMICIAFIGNYQERELTQEQISSCTTLLLLIQRVHRAKKIGGHRDWVATLCPGERAYNQLRRGGIIC